MTCLGLFAILSSRANAVQRNRNYGAIGHLAGGRPNLSTSLVLPPDAVFLQNFRKQPFIQMNRPLVGDGWRWGRITFHLIFKGSYFRDGIIGA